MDAFGREKVEREGGGGGGRRGFSRFHLHPGGSLNRKFGTLYDHCAPGALNDVQTHKHGGQTG